MGKITVVGLGPGNGRYLTRSAWDLLTQSKRVYLRTAKHPTVKELPTTIAIESFDYLYETADSFEDVYETIVGRLLTIAQEEEIVYAVPGHPFVGESTVTGLVERAEAQGVAIQIEPGLSFIEPMLTAVKLDGFEGFQLFDALAMLARHIPPINPDVPLIIGQVYNNLIASELKLNLMTLYPDEHSVVLVHGAGADAFELEEMPLYELDRSKNTAHLTSLYVPPLPYSASLPALAETVAILRSPKGCPWDQKQTPQSMRDGFLEEASEVLDALDNNDPFGLEEELGDMFFHLLFQVQLAREDELFRLSDVLAGIDAKLRRRHPHVWGDLSVADSDEVVVNWEEIKRREKGDVASESVLDNIPLALPALARSQKIQGWAGKTGFDWPDIEGVIAKFEEELGELKTAVSPEEKLDELGDVLFTTVNLARWMDVDAETALREANNKFTRRFQKVEQLASERHLDMSKMDIDELEALWQEAKQALGKRLP
ncbi:MAG: nucleoside triphosphate pyrophosphohydrolase [Chloroflexota bacterium]